MCVVESDPLRDELEYQRILRILLTLPGMSEHEAILFARSLAATPDERWEMNTRFLRSLGCSSLSAKLALSSR